MSHAPLPSPRRRTVVAGAIALAVGLPLAASAQSGAYPNKPIRAVVPSATGSPQ